MSSAQQQTGSSCCKCEAQGLLILVFVCSKLFLITCCCCCCLHASLRACMLLLLLLLQGPIRAVYSLTFSRSTLLPACAIGELQQQQQQQQQQQRQPRYVSVLDYHPQGLLCMQQCMRSNSPCLFLFFCFLTRMCYKQHCSNCCSSSSCCCCCCCCCCVRGSAAAEKQPEQEPSACCTRPMCIA